MSRQHYTDPLNLKANRVCSKCGGTECVEWELDYVWRRNRSKTVGSRVVEAIRKIDPPVYLCNGCLYLERHKLVDSNQGSLF